MAVKRGISPERVKALLDVGAAGEAFGCYFGKDGKVLCSTSAVGVNISDTKNIPDLIAVAGGKNKAEAILSTELNNANSTLITDEGAAREMLKIIKNNA